MRFRELYKNDDLMFCVGRDVDTGSGIMMVTITSVGWRDLYFSLTEEEMAEFESDVHALDDLAQRLAVDKGVKFYADRLIKR
jgi:hypothetical protein